MRVTGLVARLMAGFVILGADARGQAANQSAPDPAPSPATEAGRPVGTGDTLKERLSDKASDEQRVDNCKVPANRRGTRARPDGCAAGDQVPGAVPRGKDR